MTIPSVSLGATSTVPTTANPTEPLHVQTPLLYSSTLSVRTGHNIFLKLDTDQPLSSFKIRGIGAICQQAVLQHGCGSNTHLISSSGGNAGLAVAYAASRARVGCTIYTPLSTETDVVEKLRSCGARVVVGGEAWDSADRAAREEVERIKGAVYVHPFEGDLLAQGHSSLIDEVYTQLPQVDVLISSVGGGGLLRGIIAGVSRKPHPPVLVAVQNFGVDSFNRSFDHYLSSRTEQVVQLQKIESKCTSMGTKRCSPTTLSHAIRYHTSDEGEIVTLTVTDSLSASACWQFTETPLDGKQRLVELSCASCLTPVYHPWILERVLEASERLKGKKGLNIVVEVCGGSKVNKRLVEEYKKDTGLMEGGDRVRVSGVDYPSLSRSQ